MDKRREQNGDDEYLMIRNNSTAFFEECEILLRRGWVEFHSCVGTDVTNAAFSSIPLYWVFRCSLNCRARIFLFRNDVTKKEKSEWNRKSAGVFIVNRT